MAFDLLGEVGIWISAFFILAVYSYLYKYNNLFKFAEHTLIGAAAGHYLTMGINNIRTLAIGNILAGNYQYIIAVLFGLTLYMRFFKGYEWIQRYGFCFMIGVGVSIQMRALIVTRITAQIAATLNKISISSGMDILNSIILVGFVTTTMLYFLFTEKYTTDSKAVGFIRKIGRYGLMTAIGYYLGQTVMTRLAFVINRLEFLLFEWLRVPRM